MNFFSIFDPSSQRTFSWRGGQGTIGMLGKEGFLFTVTRLNVHHVQIRPQMPLHRLVRIQKASQSVIMSRSFDKILKWLS